MKNQVQSANGGAKVRSGVPITEGYQTRMRSGGRPVVTSRASSSMSNPATLDGADQLRKKFKTYVTTGSGASNNANDQ